jgi:hypothetical protein
MSKLGFIGLGIMGTPMAGHLQAAGHQLVVHTIGPVPDSLVKNGAKVCTSGKDVGEQSEIVFIMVPDTPDVEKVLFAPSGVAEGVAPVEIKSRLFDCHTPWLHRGFAILSELKPWQFGSNSDPLWKVVWCSLSATWEPKMEVPKMEVLDQAPGHRRGR